MELFWKRVCRCHGILGLLSIATRRPLAARSASRLPPQRCGSWRTQMLMTGEDYLESIRDGRRVYVGGEVVEDVTSHPAFRNAARSFAMIYDRKRDPENRDLMTFEEDGETFSAYFLLPRTRADLHR